MENTAPIKGFVENSFVDWPGKMAGVIFLGTCNYRCPYCHNHRLATNPEEFGTWPLDEVLGKLENLRDWLDGVCVTGGEPTISKGLIPLLELLKAKNWPVKLDTNGSHPEIIKEILDGKLAAAFSVDVKAPLEPIPYRRNAGPGSDPEKVRQTLQYLAKSGLPVELRTTVHPKLLSLDELKRLAGDIRTIFGSKVTWKLQNCRVEDTLDPALAGEPPLDAEEFERWKGEL